MALQPRTTKQTLELGIEKVMYFFIVNPESPYHLLERDLVAKIKAQIHFTGKGVTISPWPEVYALCLDLKEYRLF